MTRACRLIVNADDFGLSPGVNAGVIAARERGILTSASLMTRGQAASEAAAYARDNPSLGLGLHLDFGEWRYESGEWRPLYEVVSLDDHDAVAHEAARQLARFRALVGRDPDHLDSHQHVHTRGPARAVVRALAAEFGVPVRHDGTARYCGDFYGQTTEGASRPEAVSVDAMIAILARLSSGGGAVELCCHPAAGDDLAPTDTMYQRERLLELATLCDPAVRAAVTSRGIDLSTFSSLAAASAAGREA